MSTDANRRTHVPAGAAKKKGGQFAIEPLHATGGDLVPEKDWGTTTVQEGSRTPWGAADNVERIADGIASVGTPSHGGYKLSPERNKAIPAPLRNSSGWYEEDCEANIVAWVHTEARRGDHDAEQSVKDWFPDGYEKATGTVLKPGESREKDRKTWLAAHAGDWIVNSASMSDDHPGMVVVTADVGGSYSAAAERTFLVPEGEYRIRRTDSAELGQDWRFVVDPARHEDITKPKVPETKTTRYTGIDGSRLTTAGRERLAKDLSQRWRHEDGTVQTVGEMIAAEHMSGKHISIENGKRVYALESKETNETSSVHTYQVSRSTWDAFEAPDTRTPVERARHDFVVTEHAVDRARKGAGTWRSVKETRALQVAQTAHAIAAKAYQAARDNADDVARARADGDDI